MLQEPEEVAIKRKQTRETLRVLQQAFRVSDICVLHVTAWLPFFSFLLTFNITTAANPHMHPYGMIMLTMFYILFDISSFACPTCK